MRQLSGTRCRGSASRRGAGGRGRAWPATRARRRSCRSRCSPSAALPWLAFFDGHPVPHPLHGAARGGGHRSAGLAWGCSGRGHGTSAAVARPAGVVAAFELRPLDATAPMVVEAQWDRPNAPRGTSVTRACAATRRRRNDHGQHGIARPLHAGAVPVRLRARDFLHEGNGDIWLAALEIRARCRLAADRGEGRRRRHARERAPARARVSSTGSTRRVPAAGWRSYRETANAGCARASSALRYRASSEPDAENVTV